VCHENHSKIGGVCRARVDSERLLFVVWPGNDDLPNHGAGLGCLPRSDGNRSEHEPDSTAIAADRDIGRKSYGCPGCYAVSRSSAL
jgi:hypothetical protein